MQAIWYALEFLFGSTVGSFINVVVSRLNPGDTRGSVGGRSHCDACRRVLQWYELVPVLSFLIQGGRCRQCNSRIPVRFLFVEACLGFLFPLLAWRLHTVFPMEYGGSGWGWGLGLIALWWLIASVMVAIAAYDFSYYLIPDALLYCLIGLGALLNGYTALLVRYAPAFPETGIVFSGPFGYFLGRDAFSWVSPAWGVAFCVGVVGVAYVLSRGKAMGFGDVLLAIGLGLAMGWPDALIGMLAGFVAGTLVSVYLIYTKQKTVKDIVPFAPFLVFGALVAVLFSGTIIQGYFSFFSSLFGL